MVGEIRDSESAQIAAGGFFTNNVKIMGMGLFYTLYYVCFSITLWLSGKRIASTGVVRVFDFGAAIAVLSLVFVWLSLYFYRR